MDRKFDSVVSYYFTAASLALLLSQATASLVVAPENRVAAVGQSVRLDCSTDDRFSVNWQHFPLESTTPLDVYISRTVVFPYHLRFVVQSEALGVNMTAYNLVITDIRMEDAGTYRCVDRTGMGEQRDAELTVIGSLPKCTTNIEPNGFISENDCGHPIDKIRSSCRIEYAGNIAPGMKWMTTSGQDAIQPQPITNVSEKTVSSEWSFNSTTSMNGTLVVWFSTQSTQTKWTSAPIKTLYAKKNLTTLILSQSEPVTCVVNSSQNCSYTWIVRMDPDNELQIIERQTLEVNKPGIYLCHAQCPLHQLPCTVEAQRVEYRNGNQYQSTLLTLIPVITICSVVIVVIILVIAICIRRRNCFYDSTSSSKSGSLESLVKWLFPCFRQNSNDTTFSSKSPPLKSGSETLLEHKFKINDASPAYYYEKERQVDAIALC